MKRVTAWLLVLPLVVVGTQLAHETAYRIVAPSEPARAVLLEHAGHAYLSYAPIAAGFGFALMLLTLPAFLCQAARGSARTSVSPWAFAALAPLGFFLQEHCERLLHDGAVPWTAALEPTFAVGLVLQLPFTLAAYVFARALLGLAERLGRRLAGRPPAHRPRPLTSAWPALAIDLPRIPALALGHAERGPPAV